MKHPSFKNVLVLAIGLAFLIVCSSCATVQQKLGITGTYFTHVVKWPGESLSIIAGWYTGDVQNWKALAEANPDINPNRIHEGMKLRIPESMMKTKAAMTKDYVDSYYPKPKKPPTKPSSPAPAKDKDEEPVLYGPKQYPAK
jgi:hypothetical protein